MTSSCWALFYLLKELDCEELKQVGTSAMACEPVNDLRGGVGWLATPITDGCFDRKEGLPEEPRLVDIELRLLKPWRRVISLIKYLQAKFSHSFRPLP